MVHWNGSWNSTWCDPPGASRSGERPRAGSRPISSPFEYNAVPPLMQRGVKQRRGILQSTTVRDTNPKFEPRSMNEIQNSKSQTYSSRAPGLCLEAHGREALPRVCASRRSLGTARYQAEPGNETCLNEDGWCG